MLPKNLNNIRFTSATELNRRITLQQPGTGADSEGTPATPVTVATNVPAKITQVPSRGRPDVQEQITESVNYYEVTIRYRSDVKSDWRVLGPNGEIWTVTSINNVDFANVELRLIVREVNGGAT
jgi:SPP1 family predicted phage head-tail adaptor